MLTFVILPIAAFLLALLSLAVLIFSVGIASKWTGRLFHYLMLLIVTASIGGISLSDRVLRFGEQGLVVGIDGDAGGVIAKLLLVAVVGFSFAMCVAWPIIINGKEIPISRFKGAGTFPPNDIVASFMAFFVAFSILPIIFGEKFYFHVSLIYPFFVFSALFLWLRFSNIDPVIVAKQCLAIVVFGSLGSAVFATQSAMQPGYAGLVPGFDFRLWGVTASANTLGSVAATLFVLEVAERSGKRWLSLCILIGSGAALILTQSKTSIIAAIVGMAIILGWRLAKNIREKNPLQNKNSAFITAGVIMVFSFVATSVAAWTMFSDISLISAIEGKLASRAVGDMTTATGRTYIWKLAIQGGLENPLFGQGANFWGLEARLRSGYTGATHAHNLFLQVFSRSGFIGLISLLVFLYFLVVYSVRASKLTNGGSLALVTVMLTRALFEVPIQPNSILGAEFFAMMACFIYAIDRGGKPVIAEKQTV